MPYVPVFKSMFQYLTLKFFSTSLIFVTINKGISWFFSPQTISFLRLNHYNTTAELNNQVLILLYEDVLIFAINLAIYYMTNDYQQKNNF